MQKGPACRQAGSVQLLLILFAVLLIGSVIFIFQNRISKKNATIPIPQYNVYKNYDSYSDKALGFEFQYAKDQTVKEDSEEEFNKRGNGDYRKNFKGYIGYEPGKVLGAFAVLDNTNSFGTNPFSVWVFNNDSNLTIEQWFSKYWYYPFMWGVFDYISKGHIALDSEATVSGQAAKYKIVTYQPGKPKFIYISKDQRMYLFRVIGDTGEKILSTFAFQ